MGDYVVATGDIADGSKLVSVFMMMEKEADITAQLATQMPTYMVNAVGEGEMSNVILTKILKILQK